MKLLLENWRQYLAESEKAQDYGYLYLFEGDTVRKTSFYDALNLLNENENAIETFLENWERSVDYHIEQIDEAALADMSSNPILYLSTQAFMLLDRVKEKAIKYAGQILGVVNKVRSFLSRFEEKHPALYKMGAFAIKIVVAILVIYVISHIFGGGDAQAGDVLNAPDFPIDPATGAKDYSSDMVQTIKMAEKDLRELAEACSNVEGLKEVGQELLEIANNPADVDGGIGGDLSWKAQKVIEHSLSQMRAEDLAPQNARVFGPMIDAAKAAADGATETIRVTQTTISDPDMLAQQKKMADALKDSGL